MMFLDDLKHFPETIRHEVMAYLASNNFKAAKALYDKWFHSSSTKTTEFPVESDADLGTD